VARSLSTRSATALYVGAVLGPGVLLIPSLAAEAAGPASIVAWVSLLALSVPLALTFAALGVRFPTGAVTGWWFLAGVIIGAPAVALIGGNYVADLLGAGRTGAVIGAATMIGIVVSANVAGVHTTAKLQLVLAGVLAALLVVAVVSALPESREEHWTPFAPHGWAAVGTAASLLMFSFIGWEAVSHLAGELRDPERQLPRAIFAALGVVVVLYVGLAVATIGVLGSGKPSSVPLAELMQAGLGAPGRTATAVLAVLLTIGTMNAYVAAAVQLSGALAREGSSAPRLGRPPVALAALAGISAVLLVLLAADVLGTEDLIHASGAAFVAVYVSATAAGAKLLSGAARVASGVAFAAVVVVFAFAGAFVAVPAAIGAAVVFATRRRRAVAAPAPCPAAS
jgi:amino acid efflux transporter